MPKVTESTIPFGNHETWVRVTEPDTSNDGALPLVVLHGGPGMAHNYLRNLAELVTTGRTVILYDQIGCGNSTHLPDAPTNFWTPQLFVDEFMNLVQELHLAEYHLLGQSWGWDAGRGNRCSPTSRLEESCDMQFPRLNGLVDRSRRRTPCAAARDHPTDPDTA